MSTWSVTPSPGVGAGRSGAAVAAGGGAWGTRVGSTGTGGGVVAQPAAVARIASQHAALRCDKATSFVTSPGRAGTVARPMIDPTPRPAPGRPLPLVSVLVPSYNGAAFLREALDSILAQTYPHLEVLLLDDASTDETPAIAASYGDRITYVASRRTSASTTT